MQKGTEAFVTNLNPGFVFFALVFSLSSIGVFAATPGGLDTTFNSGTAGMSANTMQLQPDGKIIVAGAFFVTRLNPDGTVDSKFNAGNVASYGNAVWCSYLYPDGKILIGGGFFNNGRSRIARLNSDGTIDSSFDPGEGPNGNIYAMLVQADGKIIIGGQFSTYSSQPALNLCRINSDGTLDSNFLASADNAVEALAMQADGMIVAAGWFTHLNGSSQNFVARLTSNGSVDPSFVSNVNEPVQCLSLQKDGRLLIGGFFAFPTGASLARLRTDGSLDASFGMTFAGIGQVDNITLQADGRVLIGGLFSSVNGVSRTNIARIFADGSTDLSFVASPDNNVSGILIQPDNRLIIAGGFGSVQGLTEHGLARLYGDDPNGVPAVQINGQSYGALQSDASVQLTVFRVGNTNPSMSVLYGTADLEAQAGIDYIPVSGSVTFAPGEVAKTISINLMNDGEMDNFERFSFLITDAAGGVLGPITNMTVTILGVNSQIQIATQDFVTNELAGTISCTLSRVLTNIASSVLCQTVAGSALPGVQFIGLSQRVNFAPGQTNASVFVSIVDNDQAGPDTSFSVQISNPLGATIGARSNLTVSITENDAPDHPAPGMNSSVSVVRTTLDGGIILGGAFTSANGNPRKRLVKIFSDGTAATNFDTSVGFDALVNSLLPQSNGSMVVGGTFSSYNGIARSGIARLNSDASLDQAFDSGGIVDGTVRAIAPVPDGGYYIAGAFSSYAGTARPGIAKINSNGSLNTNFIPQIPQISPAMNVLCLTTQSGGGLLAGADSGFSFFSANTNILFRLRPDGARDVTFSNVSFSSFFSSARVNALLLQDDGKIVVGGQFSNRGIARFTANGGSDSSFNPSGGVLNGSIARLLSLTNGQIITVGSFSSYGGISRKNICRINSNGSLDTAFDAGTGTDGLINDIWMLPDGRFAIGGTFRRFGGFPRYGFAILNSNGALTTNIKIESFNGRAHLQFGLDIEPDRPFYIQQSADLVNWQIVHSDFLHVPFTNISLAQPPSDRAYFRIQQ